MHVLTESILPPFSDWSCRAGRAARRALLVMLPVRHLLRIAPVEVAHAAATGASDRTGLPGGRHSRLLLVEHRIRLDVDLRAGQLGGEARVLPFLADRQRQLVVGHQRANRLERLVDDERAGHPGR
jgi:hypothetical protein